MFIGLNKLCGTMVSDMKQNTVDFEEGELYT